MLALALIAPALAAGGYWYVNRTEKLPLPPEPESYSFTVEPATSNSGDLKRNVNFRDLFVIPADGSTTVFEMFEITTRKFGSRKALGSRPLVKIVEESKIINGQEKKWQFYQLGEYNWLTYDQAFERACQFGCGLLTLGLKSGGRLAIVEETRQEWTLAAQGSFSQGITVLTAYANLGEDGIAYSLQLGETTHVLANAKEIALLGRLKKTIVPTLKHVIYTDQLPADFKAPEGLILHSFDQVVELGKNNHRPIQKPHSNDLCVIMFTSGSTGEPKGVVLTHGNVTAAIGAAIKGLDVSQEDVYLSYLPLAHILAFVIECGLLWVGAAIGHGHPRTLVDTNVRNCKGDITELRPTVMAGVPTVYEKIKAGIERKINSAPAIKKKLFELGFNARLAALQKGYDTPFWSKLVFNQFKDVVGGRMRFMVSGGAPLSPELHSFLRVCFGVPILQGYGLTETCGPSNVQLFSDSEIGTVGPPIGSIEIKLVDVPDMGYTHNDKPNPRGEIWVRGPSVGQGYYKKQDLTAEAFINGWFATGDVGEWTPKGTLKIIDRKKNLIKPLHGEYIALEKLESTYKNSSFVENICVYVDGTRYHCVAVISVNRPNVEDWAAKNNLQASVEELCESKELKTAVLQSLNEVARKSKLKSIELLRAVHLDPQAWTPETQFLTAAMKIQRRKIVAAFQKQIDLLYKDLPKE